ncbi:MAG: NnrS family protein [Betaproteobacteria bacterium]|nr:NnrS family protein [Betaproteobacteria bacterium]
MVRKPDTAAGLSWVTAAPHRLFFFLGIVHLVFASAWWTYVVAARAFAWPQPQESVPLFVHAAAMIYGFLPFFMFGFLFTAGPLWLKAEPLPARALAPAAWSATAGSFGIVVASWLSPEVSGMSALVFAAAWGVLLARFFGVIRRSPVADRLHAKLILVFMLIGLAGLVSYSGLMLSGRSELHTVTVGLGLWGFALPVFLTVMHRMLPFFTSSALPFVVPWRPNWVLSCLLAGVLAHGALELAGLGRFTWLADAPSAAWVLWLSIRWGLLQSLKIRLLAMLHLGFAWLGIGYLLFAADALLRAADAGGLGYAPLHALTMGFAGSLLFAMATRVSVGHSGGTLVADDATWRLFLACQAAVLLRLAADALPAYQSYLMVGAALAWLSVFTVWTQRYLPLYLRPRADGHPG